MNSSGVLLADRQSRQSLGALSYRGPSSVGKSSVVMLLQGKYAAQVDSDSSCITHPPLPLIGSGSFRDEQDTLIYHSTYLVKGRGA